MEIKKMLHDKLNLCFENVFGTIELEKINLLYEKELLLKGHHGICKTLFQNAENGDELFVSIDYIYSNDEDGKEIETSKKENKSQVDDFSDFVRVSILTKSMIDYDKYIFDIISERNEDEHEDIYRPYFYHYLINIDNLNNNALKFISNPENLGKWFIGNFNENIFIDSETTIELDGYIEETASPIIYKSRKLYITDKSLSKDKLNYIESTYAINKLADETLINNELNNLLHDVTFEKIRTYNVGTGNCVYLYGDKNKRRVLFDIGYDVNLAHKKFGIESISRQAAHAIRNLKPTCVILSHWDSDHYMGCAYAKQDIFKCIWIAPNCYDAGVNAKRLAKYLDVNKKLLLVDRKCSGIFAIVNSKYSIFDLYMGKRASELTKQNEEGIVLHIRNKKSNIDAVMAGDVPYNAMPRAGFLSQCGCCTDFLVVPHHGSKMDCSNLSNLKCKNKKYAIICTRRGIHSNGVMRPNADHENELIKRGFTVKLTTESKFRIDYSLKTGNININ